ncbi:MAG: aminotransferase class III-fold pyridoxal phosphate-dependent enzyme [Candidatus Aminicenantes bacterium]|nr:MAG: aminotransferase class III-fold pyridoxal phosphate-dependent enzyme [Candidatus Aminicenantes bacterium]
MDKKKLLDDLVKGYRENHKKSEAIFSKASQYLITGGSHNLRLFSPFPFYDIQSSGSRVWDADGNIYVDFWQGHFANVLGHNPKVIIKALQDSFRKSQGLTTGFPGDHQRELAELILKQIKADKIRFTTSGTLATMYAIMLAKAFTRRELVMKVGGGWHGAHPYALRGITAYDHGLTRMESAGLPSGTDAMIVMTRFNDIQDIEDKFREHGERTACFILEPFIGAGGFIFSHKQYLQRARELTQQYGSLLIFDEVVSGFRFHAGGVQSLYGIIPDLTVLGKAIGGGMPVSAVIGKEDVMALCGPEAPPDVKVKFEGGTFSAHPAAMLAGLTYLKYLMEHESEIYPRIGQLGAKVRKGIEEIFAAHGFNVKCTGYGDSIAEHSSLVGVQFLKERIDRISFPEQVWNPEVCDFELREKIFKLSMLEEGFNIFHGYGAVSSAHTESEIQASLDAVERIAKKWSNY